MFISAQNTQHTFSRSHKPVAVIQSGDVIQLETLDCFSNRLRSGIWQPTPGEMENPITGPVYVEGAQPGHTLRIEVLDLHLEAFGVIESVKGSGCLGTYICQNSARIVPIRDGEAILSEQLRIPLRPMIGVLGVAPASDEPMTMLPGVHGGNLDCTRITTGSTVYLPVFVPGALLAAGDLHAAMGDGEVGVSGLEIPGVITLRVSTERHRRIRFPVICCGGRVYTAASARTMDEACEEASRQMYQLLSSMGGLCPEDTVALMTVAADLHVCQIVNPLKTAAMSVPGDYLSMF